VWRPNGTYSLNMANSDSFSSKYGDLGPFFSQNRTCVWVDKKMHRLQHCRIISNFVHYIYAKTSLCSVCQLHAFERTIYLQKLKVKGKSLQSDNYKCRIDCQLLWKKTLPNKPILQKLASSMMHFLSTLIMIPYFLYAWEFTKIWSNITPMAVRFELNVVLHLQTQPAN
jgi:hypothetical protein